jgi:hypothetical protein
MPPTPLVACFSPNKKRFCTRNNKVTFRALTKVNKLTKTDLRKCEHCALAVSRSAYYRHGHNNGTCTAQRSNQTVRGDAAMEFEMQAQSMQNVEHALVESRQYGVDVGTMRGNNKSATIMQFKLQ